MDGGGGLGVRLPVAAGLDEIETNGRQCRFPLRLSVLLFEQSTPYVVIS